MESQPNWLTKKSVDIPTKAESQVVADTLVALLGSRVLVSVTMESQPSWLTRNRVKMPTKALSQVVAEALVASFGSKVVVTVTMESQPNWLTKNKVEIPTKALSQVVADADVESTAAESNNTVVTIVESQPNWLTRCWVNTPNAAGSQANSVIARLLEGRSVVVVTTTESQPNRVVRSCTLTPANVESQVVALSRVESLAPGLTVIETLTGVPVQLPSTGVAVMTAVCGVATLAVVKLKSPVPFAGKPMAGLSFVQLTVAPADAPNARLMPVFPQAARSFGCVKVGVGPTVMVKVCGGVMQVVAAVMKLPSEKSIPPNGIVLITAPV